MVSVSEKGSGGPVTTTASIDTALPTGCGGPHNGTRKPNRQDHGPHRARPTLNRPQDDREEPLILSRSTTKQQGVGVNSAFYK
jgi:hypothetical protein